MTDPEPPWLAHRRTLFMRYDAHHYLRQDYERFLPPGAGYQEPAYFKARREREALAEAKAAQAQAEERAFRNELAAIRFELLLLKTALDARRRWRAKAGFDPSQPRVPAGIPDGGQWTDGNGNSLERSDRESVASEGFDVAYVIRICIASGISRFGDGTYRVTYDCFDGRTITRHGVGAVPGLIRDPGR
ncbi:MAG: hypothetical protein NW215_03785 [Hyphomicrobiales bacterium]|nr:hypothetical protein [Hyphomicrobiales bacterium]